MAFAISFFEPSLQKFFHVFMIAGESESHTRTRTTKRLASRACPRPPVILRVTFMRDARAPAAGHSNHFNLQHWFLCHTGFY
jgi:hypothetical protein